MRIPESPSSGGSPSLPRSDTQIYSAESMVESEIPLQDMQRSSTETTRRNGYRQSVAPDRATRIMEDIQNGNYICSICTDAVIQRGPDEYCMWQCGSCCAVFHFKCIQRWSDPDEGSIISSLRRRVSWTCPQCFIIYHETPYAKCWCGKLPCDRDTIPIPIAGPARPNSCPYTCGKVAKCEHNRDTTSCLRACHPGPCNQPCKANCTDLQFGPEKANVWARLCSRFKTRKPGSVAALVLGTAWTAAVEIAILCFVIKHIGWWTQPSRHQYFTEVSSRYEYLLILFIGLSVVLPFQVIVVASWIISIGHFSTHLLNFENMETRKGLKTLTRLIGSIILGLTFATAVLGPVIAIIHGPKMAWYNQFRHSCKGFETRVRMDERIRYETGLEGSIKPTQEFNFTSLDSEGEFPPFYLGAHLAADTKSNSTQSFQYYYRFGGRTRRGHNLAVDVDTDDMAWRMVQLSGPDYANKWLSQISRGPSMPGESRLPQLPTRTESLVRNGTLDFNMTIPGHVYIPELEFMIGNVIDFTRRCEYEPFIRVYSVDGLDTKEKRASGDAPWSSRSGDRVLMRGASFGHGRKRLDMCLKEGPVVPQGPGDITDKTQVADELMVPLAIIAALRHRIWESRGRYFDC